MPNEMSDVTKETWELRERGVSPEALYERDLLYAERDIAYGKRDLVWQKRQCMAKERVCDKRYLRAATCVALPP